MSSPKSSGLAEKRIRFPKGLSLTWRKLFNFHIITHYLVFDNCLHLKMRQNHMTNNRVLRCLQIIKVSVSKSLRLRKHMILIFSS